jgi:pyrimidine-nucleoside phosphorylase
LEVKESIELLRGEVEDDARPALDLSIELAAHMLLLSHVDDSLEAARDRLQKVLSSGEALECFRNNVKAQGGEPRVCDEPARFLPLVKESFKVESPRSGFITKINTPEVGHAIAAIGGGRVRIDDAIDPTVGFITAGKLGDHLKADGLIGTIYCRDPSKSQDAAKRIQRAYQIGDLPVEIPPLIKEVINE